MATAVTLAVGVTGLHELLTAGEARANRAASTVVTVATGVAVVLLEEVLRVGEVGADLVMAVTAATVVIAAAGALVTAMAPTAGLMCRVGILVGGYRTRPGGRAARTELQYCPSGRFSAGLLSNCSWTSPASQLICRWPRWLVIRLGCRTNRLT